MVEKAQSFISPLWINTTKKDQTRVWPLYKIYALIMAMKSSNR